MIFKQEFSFYEIKKQNKILIRELSSNIFIIITLIFILFFSNNLYQILNKDEYIGLYLLTSLEISTIILILFLINGFYILYSTLEINEKNLQLLWDEMNNSKL